MKTKAAVRYGLTTLRTLILRVAYLRSGMRVVINGQRVRIDPRVRWLSGEYEPRVAELLRQHVTPGNVCFDVGAHVGVFVLLLGELAGPCGRVYAFEPNPASRALLKRHVRWNGYADRTQIEPLAVSEEQQNFQFHSAGISPMSRLGAENPIETRHHKRITVHCTSLDAYVAEHGLQPDVLLIDIEGFEVAALRGAVQLLRSLGHKMLTIVEMHPDSWHLTADNASSVAQLLRDLRLSASPLSGQQNPLDQHGLVRLQGSHS